MKLDVIDFARRVGISVDEANKWLEDNWLEADVLIEMAYNKGWDCGYNAGIEEGY